MIVPFVDLKIQYESIKEEIDHAIQTVIENTSFIGGEPIKKFEQSFAAFVGTKHAIGCANGTDAIEIALKTLGVGPGDEVIVPALTWISTAGAVANVGAKPVFCDVLEAERTIDPGLIEGLITPWTKAIIPVHLYGLPARMDRIMQIADSHGLKIMEDCAQAHGATFKGQSVGTFGHMATFSFYPGKNLGAYGDSGAIVTNSDEWEKTSRMLVNHGQLQKHSHQIVGRNSRLDTMQAAILSAKLPHLDTWIEGRIKAAASYDELLEDVAIPITPEGFRHVFHLYVIQSHKRDKLIEHFKSSGIGCAIHYPTPLPFVDCFDFLGHQPGDFPIAEKLCREILSLPIYPEITREQLSHVASTLAQAL